MYKSTEYISPPSAHRHQVSECGILLRDGQIIRPFLCSFCLRNSHFAHHAPETEEYGITSFVYLAREPFDPARIHAVLNGDLPGVIRAKGHFWIASRPNWVAEFSLAGSMSSVSPLGGWWASVPRVRWPTHPDALAEVAQKWQELWGDRRQEIVFIGAGLDRAAITAALDAALVTSADFTPEAWRDLPDPFPAWRRTAAA